MDILALLDKPSPKSFGMVPVIVRCGICDLYALDGRVQLLSVDRVRIDELCASGHAYDVSALGASIEGAPRPLVAGWLGAEFLENARRLGAPEPPVTDARFVFEPHGSFWVDAPQDVFGCLKRWTLAAARRVFIERNAALADLMAWALPDEQETIAAIWWTRGSDEDRKRYLRLAMRIREGRGQKLDAEKYASVLAGIAQTYIADSGGDRR
jgi:hypothetical protein